MKLKPTLALTLMFLAQATVADAEDECIDDWPYPEECFPDVLCEQYAEYWDLRRAVVHLYGPDIGGTGVLINNADCDFNEVNCGETYLLTANHVVSGHLGAEMSSGERNALQTETSFTFNLEAATCGGPTSTGAVAVVGAQVIAHSAKADLILLKLSTSLPPELGAYFVGWCEGPVDQAVSISHPCGAPKRIAISEFGEIVFVEIYGREVFDVYWWEDGALASGSSGAPLLDRSTGELKGILTNTIQDGSASCSNPSDTPAQDRFSAISSILDVLPASVDAGATCIGHFDSNENAPLLGTVEDSGYYGPGVVHEISATEAVWLVDGFVADYGSNVTAFTTGNP